MSARSVAIYTFSSIVYISALFIYGNIRGPEFWNDPILYGYAAIILFMVVVALWLKLPKGMNDSRPWFVYVLLPLTSPILLTALVCFWVAAFVTAVVFTFYD